MILACCLSALHRGMYQEGNETVMARDVVTEIRG